MLGAGVMGAQIAAHFANCNIPVLLFELAASGTDPNANVVKAVENLHKLEPSPLSVQSKAAQIEPANYDQHLPLLADCDLVIEAIAERSPCSSSWALGMISLSTKSDRQQDLLLDVGQVRGLRQAGHRFLRDSGVRCYR